jgi:hypothetical protein
MNAAIRAVYEAIVESTETIEAHLFHIRKDVDECKSDLRELRTEVRTEVKSLREKIDQGYARFDAKIDKNCGEINASIGVLREGVASLRGMQIAILWVPGVIATIAGLAGAGKIFKWF